MVVRRLLLVTERPFHLRVRLRADLGPPLRDGVSQRGNTVIDLKLAQDGRHMVLDRLLRDEQRVADLFVGLTHH